MADTQTPGSSGVAAERKMPVGRPWPPGVSGNPSGRAKTVGPVRELAREYTVNAIQTLAEIADDVTLPPAARVAAASALLDRGYGKPTQPLEHTGEDGGALTIIVRKEQAP